MKKYLSFFRIRFLTGLQYRAAALAGISTQFAWGIMSVLLYSAFYRADPGAFPMEFHQTASYIWLRQGFLTLFALWQLDNDIFSTITDGGVAYELCRPAGLYQMWFVKNLATRLSRVALRSLPIVIFALFLPEPYGLGPPPGWQAGVLFLVSLVLGAGVIVAFCMLLYISVFYTLSPLGVRILAISLVDFLSGSFVPLNFFPEKIRRVVELLPFAVIQDLPLRLYSGNIAGREALFRVGLQVFWLIVLVAGGMVWMKRATKRVVVQGG